MPLPVLPLSIRVEEHPGGAASVRVECGEIVRFITCSDVDEALRVGRRVLQAAHTYIRQRIEEALAAQASSGEITLLQEPE